MANFVCKNHYGRTLAFRHQSIVSFGLTQDTGDDKVGTGFALPSWSDVLQDVAIMMVFQLHQRWSDDPSSIVQDIIDSPSFYCKKTSRKWHDDVIRHIYLQTAGDKREAAELADIFECPSSEYDDDSDWSSWEDE